VAFRLVPGALGRQWSARMPEEGLIPAWRQAP